jgi:hypothetical protein
MIITIVTYHFLEIILIFRVLFIHKFLRILMNLKLYLLIIFQLMKIFSILHNKFWIIFCFLNVSLIKILIFKLKYNFYSYRFFKKLFI